MEKRRLGLLLISFIGLFLFFIHTQAKAENWKSFFKDKEGDVWYYDKDSIHYPYNSKGLLGSIKTDKNVVRVWTKIRGKEDQLTLWELRCSQRTIQIIEYQPIDEWAKYLVRETTHIIPGSWDDKLYNEVCK